MTTEIKNFITGLKIIDSVADQLNAIAQAETIPVDREDIWGVIHNLTDDEWYQIFGALGWLREQGCFTESDERTISDAADKFHRTHMLGKEWVGKPYVKHKGHKNEVWQVWMRTREIVNRYNGIYIPNGPQRKQVKLSSEFHSLFE